MIEINLPVKDSLSVSDQFVGPVQADKKIKSSITQVSQVPKSPDEVAALIWWQWMLCSMLNEKLQSEIPF
jgi:hypothetical protein